MLSILSVMLLIAKIVHAATSYQHVTFFNSKPTFQPLWHHNFYEDFHSENDFWKFPSHGFSDFFDITLGAHKDYEDDNFALDFDPYLLTGHKAKQTVERLLSKGKLFYKDIPHIRALVKLQEKRLQNGLAPNKLGSLNPNSPFAREKALSYFYPKPRHF